MDRDMRTRRTDISLCYYPAFPEVTGTLEACSERTMRDASKHMKSLS